MEVFTHPELGDITINKSLKATRLSITVKPTGVTVTIPKSLSKTEALAFVDSKRDWIKGAIERNKKRAKQPQIIIPPFATRMHKLTVIPQKESRYDIKIKSGDIVVSYPEYMTSESESVQKIIKKAISEAYRIEAKQLLPQRVDTLAKTYKFKYRAVSFRNSVSRWGSCSGDNSISLSIHLMTLPNHLIDYVILHELCHTIEKNHGPKFHKLLNEVTGGKHLLMRSELKKFTTNW